MSTTWLFGVRDVGDAAKGEPMLLTVLLGETEVLASTLLERAPTDAELSALYDEAIAGEDGARRPPPKTVLVEDAATAKRVRPLFKRGARVEIDRNIAAALDDLAEEVIERAVDAEVFDALPDGWKDDLVALGARLDEEAPWEALPPGALLRLSSPDLGIDDGRVSVMSQRSTGFVVFTSVADYDAFHASSVALARTGTMSMLPFPRIAGLEVVEVPRDGENVRVASVDARTQEGSEDATEEEILRCVTVAHLAMAYVAKGEASTEPRALEVEVRGQRVRASLSLAPR